MSRSDVGRLRRDVWVRSVVRREWELVSGRKALIQVPETQRPSSVAVVLEGWEAPGLPQAEHSAADMGLMAPRDGRRMKNTGKRIFFSTIAFVVVNLGVLVMAGALTSQR